MRHSFRHSFVAALACLGLVPPGTAQTVVDHPYDTGVVATHTLNSGPNTAFFDYHDNGGSAANYSNSAVAATSVVTFVAAPGQRIKVTFSAFQTETAFADRLFVYDGADTSAPIIPSASAAPGAFSCAALGWDGTLAPNNAGANTLVSSGNSLTFTFCRDSSVNFAGWAARVEVYVPPPPASVPALNDPAIAALALLLALGALAALRRRGSG